MNGDNYQMGNSIATTLAVVNNNNDAAVPVLRGSGGGERVLNVIGEDNCITVSCHSKRTASRPPR
jgi:hypothetical protein